MTFVKKVILGLKKDYADERKTKVIVRRAEEFSDEDLKDVFGLGVTLVTSAKTKEEAEAFLRELGLPLKKN